MQVVLNGVEKVLQEKVTVLEMVQELGLVPETMVVEVNQKIYQHNDFSSIVINEGDRIEIIRFVGGG